MIVTTGAIILYLTDADSLFYQYWSILTFAVHYFHTLTFYFWAMATNYEIQNDQLGGGIALHTSTVPAAANPNLAVHDYESSLASQTALAQSASESEKCSVATQSDSEFSELGHHVELRMENVSNMKVDEGRAPWNGINGMNLTELYAYEADIESGME